MQFPESMLSLAFLEFQSSKKHRDTWETTQNRFRNLARVVLTYLRSLSPLKVNFWFSYIYVIQKHISGPWEIFPMPK